MSLKFSRRHIENTSDKPVKIFFAKNTKTVSPEIEEIWNCKNSRKRNRIFYKWSSQCIDFSFESSGKLLYSRVRNFFAQILHLKLEKFQLKTSKNPLDTYKVLLTTPRKNIWHKYEEKAETKTFSKGRRFLSKCFCRHIQCSSNKLHGLFFAKIQQIIAGRPKVTNNL